MSIEEPTFGDAGFWQQAELAAYKDEVAELRTALGRERQVVEALANDAAEVDLLRGVIDNRTKLDEIQQDINDARATAPSLGNLLDDLDPWSIFADGVYRHSNKREAMDRKWTAWSERLQTADDVSREEWIEFSDFTTTRNCQVEQEMVRVGAVIGPMVDRQRMWLSDAPTDDDLRAAYDQVIQAIDADPSGWPSDGWDNNDREHLGS